MGEASKELITKRSKFIEGKQALPKATKDSLVYEMYMKQITELLQSSAVYMSVIEICEVPEVFYEICKDLAIFIPDELKTDVFYTLKLGYQYIGAPSKFVYVLTKAKSLYDTPNAAFASIPDNLFYEFCYSNSFGEGVSMLDVACNLWNYDIKILSPYRKRFSTVDYTEVFVKEDVSGNIVNRVAVLPASINSCITDSDLSNLVYDESCGLLIGDTLVRQMCHIGITKNDFDLREVI